MAFDACMMRAVLTEIRREFPEAKIEKVLQPRNDEIDMLIHYGRKSRRLVFNVGPNAPRLQLSDKPRENPLKAPMFCMLLRKYFVGAKIVAAQQLGFDRIAEKIYNHPEVKALYLMSSGGFDFTVLIEGKTMKEVALFVTQKLAPIDSVTATATHFVLRKYKDKGVIYGGNEIDERGNE